MISQVSRFRRTGILAVAQNTQPMAQPTCDERQTLTAPGLCNGMSTDSRGRPSVVRKRSFWKPSTGEMSERSHVSLGIGRSTASRSRRGSWYSRAQICGSKMPARPRRR